MQNEWKGNRAGHPVIPRLRPSHHAIWA